MATPAEALALATQYHATGNLALAEQFARSALKDEPNHAEALHLLGLIAHQKGNGKEAVDFLKRSLTSNESNPNTWQHLGDILFAAGDLRSGVTYYEQVLRLRPDFAEGYNTLGIAWQKLGEWASAVACFQHAIRLLPTFAAAYNNLGNALRKQGRLAEAAATLEQALRLWPDSPEIAYNLGNTHHDQGNLNPAVTCYRQALGLKPGYAAEISNSLATALKEQGLMVDAIAQFQETLQIRPDHAMASYNLGELAIAGHYRFAPEDLERIKTIMASGRCSAWDRSLHAFTLATLLNHEGAYDEAFAYYQEANELRKRLLGEQNRGFDARAHEALVDRIIATHGRSYFELTKKWGTSTDLPVFIIGMPGAGDALVEQILAGHSKVTRSGVSSDVYKFISPGASDKTADLYTTHVLANIRAARKAAADFLRDLVQIGHGADRVTIRNFDNYLHLGVIATLFSHARIIHCRRDRLDLCLSIYFENFHEMAFAWSLGDIAVYHRSYEKLMAHWSRVLPTPIHNVSYENLVDDQEATARALLGFCGLDWDEPFATFWNNRRIRQTMRAQPIGHWRNYRTHLGILAGSGEIET